MFKPCPTCGQRIPQMAVRCSNCGRQFVAPMPVSAVAGHEQPYKVCPSCQQPSVLDATVCGRCGHRYRTRFAPPPNQTQVVYPQQPPQPAPLQPWVNTPNAVPWGEPAPSTDYLPIVGMWLLTAAAWGAGALGAMPFGLILDGVAIIIAIFLVCTPSATQKANGWVKIGLEIIAFLVGFVIGMQHPFG